MDDFDFGSYHDDEDEERFQLTERGLLVARACITLFEAGWSHEEIADLMGYEGEDGKLMVQTIVAIAFHVGAIE